MKLTQDQYVKIEEEIHGPWLEKDMRSGRDFIEFNPINDLVDFYVNGLESYSEAVVMFDCEDNEAIQMLSYFMDQYSGGRWFTFLDFCKKYKHRFSVKNWEAIEDPALIEEGKKICGFNEYPKLYVYLGWKYVNQDSVEDDYSLDDFQSLFLEKYTPLGRKYITDRR